MLSRDTPNQPVSVFFVLCASSWDLAFFAAGFFILISGFLAYVTAILEDREEAATKQKDKDSEQPLSLQRVQG